MRLKKLLIFSAQYSINHCVIFSFQRPVLRLKNALLLIELIGKN